jgi:hypothetical protein
VPQNLTETGPRLFDYLVGEPEQRRWHVETECFGGVEIDHELELYRCAGRSAGFSPLRIRST